MSFSLYGNSFSKLPDGASEKKISFVLAALLFSLFLHVSLGWYGLHALKDIEVQVPRRSLEFSLVKPPDPIITPPRPLPISPVPRIASSPPKQKLIERPSSPKPELPKSAPKPEVQKPEPMREPIKNAEILENKKEVAQPLFPSSLQSAEPPIQLHDRGEQSIGTNVEETLMESSGGEVGSGSRSGDLTSGAVAGNAQGGGEIVGPIFDADYLNNPVPPYPPAARKLKLQGTVVVRVLVSPLGKAEIVQVEKSSGVSILDGAALRAVKEWFFVPAREGNNPVSAWVDVPIRFRLN